MADKKKAEVKKVSGFVKSIKINGPTQIKTK